MTQERPLAELEVRALVVRYCRAIGDRSDATWADTTCLGPPDLTGKPIRLPPDA